MRRRAPRLRVKKMRRKDLLRIVNMLPKNGSKKVDPSLTEIKVTFDRPMGQGFSWTGGGAEFPTIPEGQKPSWSADRMTATLPVTLKPNASYRLGLNSPSFKNFASADGVPLEPVVYKFRNEPREQIAHGFSDRCWCIAGRRGI